MKQERHTEEGDAGSNEIRPGLRGQSRTVGSPEKVGARGVRWVPNPVPKSSKDDCSESNRRCKSKEL